MLKMTWSGRIAFAIIIVAFLLTGCLGTLPTASVDLRKEGLLVVNNATGEVFSTLTADGVVLDTMVAPGQHLYKVQIRDRLGDNQTVRSQSVEVAAVSERLGVSYGRRVTITTNGDAREVEFDEGDFPNRPRD